MLTESAAIHTVTSEPLVNLGARIYFPSIYHNDLLSTASGFRHIMVVSTGHISSFQGFVMRNKEISKELKKV